MTFTDSWAKFWPIRSLLPCPEGANRQHSRKARQTLALTEVFSTPYKGHEILRNAYKYCRCSDRAVLHDYVQTLHSPTKTQIF